MIYSQIVTLTAFAIVAMFFQHNYTFTLYYFKVLLLVLPSVIEHKEYEIISAPTLQSFLVKCVLDFVADCCYHISSEDLEGHEEPGK